MVTTKDRLTITADHVKLLGRSFYDLDTYDEPFVSQDPKRPYGNSDVIGDLYEILLGPVPKDRHGDPYIDSGTAALLRATHGQMADVVQVLVLSVAHGFPFEVGRTYAPTRNYDALSWRPISDEQAETDAFLAAAKAEAADLNARMGR